MFNFNLHETSSCRQMFQSCVFADSVNLWKLNWRCLFRFSRYLSFVKFVCLFGFFFLDKIFQRAWLLRFNIQKWANHVKLAQIVIKVEQPLAYTDNFDTLVIKRTFYLQNFEVPKVTLGSSSECSINILCSASMRKNFKALFFFFFFYLHVFRKCMFRVQLYGK